YPGIPEVVMHTIDPKKPFYVGDARIIPIQVLHHKLPVLGFRIGQLAYITDASYIPPEEKEKLKGLDVLVINALRKKEHISHFNLAQAVELVKELNPEKAYFTHISHLLGKHADVQSELPVNTFLAWDGLVVDANI